MAKVTENTGTDVEQAPVIAGDVQATPIPSNGQFAQVEGTDAESRINSAIASLAGKGDQRIWSSVKGDDTASKLKVLAAVQDGDSLRDHLGETIALRHVVVQGVYIADRDNQGNAIVDPNTGEIKQLYVARIVLIADDGKSYASISTGIFKALENITGVLGDPETWDGPVNVKAVEQGPAMRRYLTLKVA